MSSPCKRVKLTPKKRESLVSKHNKYSQESKVTSTPQRLSGQVVSPNISRISSTGSSSVRTRLSDTFDDENKENLTESSNEEVIGSLVSSSSAPFSTSKSEKSGVIAIEDYDTYISEFRRIKYVGKVWKMYKPLHENTLYAQILGDPTNVQEVVIELLLLYNRRPEYVICKLLKFCADVCGFQNFEIADHYDFQKDVSKRVIEIMETNRVLHQQEVLINTGRYLLMEPKASLAKILKTSIYNFLQKLIICAHERGILYDDFFTKHFFVFVKCMSFSQIRAIRHTGVIFGIKILTALVMVYSKIINEEQSLSDTSSDNNIQLQKQDINNYLEFLYFIFIKNCRLPEHRVVLMKVECIYELSIWIRYFPKIFITQLQTVNYLLKLITDASRDVRFAALEICGTLVETTNVLTILKKTVPDFAEHIGKRFYDVDLKIAVKAIDIYKILLKYDESLVTTNRFKMLMNLVFSKYFPIGEAASRFLIYYLERTENNQEILLLNLAKFSMQPGDAVKQLLIEGCLNNCPAIQNWKLYINIFVQSDVELDIKEHLAELFSEAVHQVLIGRSTVLREKSRKVTIVDPAEHKKVAKYLSVLSTVLEKYMDHPKILIEFVKIFSLVKEAVLNEISVATLKNICVVMEKLFHYHSDETLLKKLCETLYYFSNITSHANNTQNVIENISLRYTNDLISNLAHLNNDIGKTVLKVSVLFTYFNLSKKLTWETIFDSWGEVDENTTGYLLSCCKWYLIWSLKNVSGIENPSSQFPILIRTCKEFTSSCFNMLQHVEIQPLRLKTYECLCDVHITYMTDLEELTKSVKQMEQLKLVIDNKQLQNVLISFLEQYVINNTTMPVFDRRSYVVKYIELVHLHVLPVECLATIFKYYYEYNQDYGPIIESSLSGIAQTDENTFLMIVIYTLTVSYENILSKYNTIDMTTQEARYIKLLIKQFLNFKEFKCPNKKFTKLTYFAINYSLKDESRYPFLHFVRYFVDLIIDNNDRKEVSEFLKEKVPKIAEKNDAVLFLANYLKNVKPGGVTEKEKSAIASQQNKENKKPRKNIEASRKKGRPKGSAKKIKTTRGKSSTKKVKNQRNVDIETDVSEDDLTIHDSESDDLEESLTALNI